jgi:hypothetical protein
VGDLFVLETGSGPRRRPGGTDRVVAFGEEHLRRVLQSHARHYQTLPRAKAMQQRLPDKSHP